MLAAGIDTWSPCWYAPPGSPLARALDALATETSGRARLLPEPAAGHRLGWFPDPRLVFAEGRASGAELLPAAEIDTTLARLCRALADLSIAAAPERCAGLRRLEVAADLRTDSAAEGLALLECVGAASLGPGKLAAYRAERRGDKRLSLSARRFSAASVRVTTCSELPERLPGSARMAPRIAVAERASRVLGSTQTVSYFWER